MSFIILQNLIFQNNKKFEFCRHCGWNFVKSSHDFHMQDEEM